MTEDPQPPSDWYSRTHGFGGVAGKLSLSEDGWAAAEQALGKELKAKVGHYLAHPAEARVIAERGLAAVRERHTFAGRLDDMLAEVMTARPVIPV